MNTLGTTNPRCLPGSWLQRGQRLQQGGCYDQAIYCYQQGLNDLFQRPDADAVRPHLVLLLGLADCYLALKRPEMALVKLDRCCRYLAECQTNCPGQTLQSAIKHLLGVWPDYQYRIGAQRPQLGEWMAQFSGADRYLPNVAAAATPAISTTPRVLH
ncbi:hypothetical protein [Parathalassolituus penaei]|uniref:Tetratricopeptide repeat protein n=1 Tax=Parathalassolituus penaei TaxID=2997323 RepID=A0A9X3IRF2_9GAMM|nr:hypothetical protein [Parathalassolituus penaei]MCY0964821.1 hypothetical protein [Parathalassolituus penaei]